MLQKQKSEVQLTNKHLKKIYCKYLCKYDLHEQIQQHDVEEAKQDSPSHPRSKIVETCNTSLKREVCKISLVVAKSPSENLNHMVLCTAYSGKTAFNSNRVIFREKKLFHVQLRPRWQPY